MHRNRITGKTGGPYHQYLVTAEMSAPGIPSSGPAFAIIRMVTDAPMPERPYPPRYEVTEGGERAAFDLAIDALKRQPRNEGMEIYVREV